MKKFFLAMSVLAVSACVFVSCETKPAATSSQQSQQQSQQSAPAAAAQASINPEQMKALVNAEWDAVPQALLDSMGVKPLKSFKEEAKEAQNDNVQYYFGKGASVELDAEGHLTKVVADDDNAVVVYLTAESVAYGSIAFRSEAAYNEFVKKVQAEKGKEADDESINLEYEPKGKKANDGYEADKWFFVDFTADK